MAERGRPRAFDEEEILDIAMRLVPVVQSVRGP
jgi:hypothetical protein